jgi:alkanesulfonate monooxygenase SsuD/methylene tetrahydromethanopterin reductase-like flavin-dependent oxidoreductase (luciferase family)
MELGLATFADDYDELFAEKLELLLEIRDHERVTWSGKHRPPLEDALVWPRPAGPHPLPIWVAVGDRAVRNRRRARRARRSGAARGEGSVRIGQPHGR